MDPESRMGAIGAYLGVLFLLVIIGTFIYSAVNAVFFPEPSPPKQESPNFYVDPDYVPEYFDNPPEREWAP